MRHGTPGESGIVGILCGIVAVGILMTVLFGDVSQWIPIVLIILVSLGVLRSTKR